MEATIATTSGLAARAAVQRASTLVDDHPLRFGMGDDGPTDAKAAERDDDVATGQPIRVLIVEDEALVALDMAMILDAAGIDVIGTKPTGDTALGAVAAAVSEGNVPDLVLMDIALRGPLDGVETAKRIKSQFDGVPVAFVTGQADPATRARAEAIKPAGYLLKPFTPEQLVSFIKRVVARS